MQLSEANQLLDSLYSPFEVRMEEAQFWCDPYRRAHTYARCCARNDRLVA